MPESRVRLGNSVATQLLKTVFGLYFIVAIVITTTQLASEYFHVKENVLHELQRLPKTFGPGIQNALWAYNQQLLESILQGMSEIPIITGIKVEDHKGEEIHSTGTIIDKKNTIITIGSDGEKNMVVDRDKIFSDLFGHTFSVIHVNEAGKKIVIGKVTVYSSTAVVLNRVKFGFILTLINAVIKTLALWFFFLIFSRKILGKPLGQLTGAVESIDFDNLKPILLNTGKKNELKVLETAFNSMIHKLSHAKATRMAAEEKLRETNTTLEVSFEQLRNTQSQLVLSEKLSTLGQLLASVAHEVNSPLGVIRSSSDLIIHNMEYTLKKLPELFKLLSERQQPLFMDLVNQSLLSPRGVTTKEERGYKKQLREKLSEQFPDSSHEIAATLVDMKIYENAEPFFPLFESSDWEFILDMAYRISSILNSGKAITSATTHATKVITALRNYSHADSSEQKILDNIRESVDTVITIYYGKIKQNVELITNYEEVPDIPCYPDELKQVWTNLIHNALHAMNYRGVLKIHIFPEPTWLRVDITDNGPGIPYEIKDRIFQAFFTTKAAGEGSGLGLDITRKIIAKHKGEIFFQSQPGETTFTVRLPLQ